MRKVGVNINKSDKEKKSETRREGERNRKFVSDSSPVKFPSISSEEMKRKSRWPWNSVAPAPTAFGPISLPADMTGRAGATSSHSQGERRLIQKLPQTAAGGPKGPLQQETRAAGERLITVLLCLLCVSAPRRIGRRLHQHLHGLVSVQETAKCRGGGRVGARPESRGVQIFNFPRFLCWFDFGEGVVSFCFERAPVQTTEFQDHPAQQRLPLPSPSITLSSLDSVSQDELLPGSPRAGVWAITVFPFNRQQGISFNLIIKKINKSDFWS